MRGGLYLVAIIGIVIANLRERLVEWFLPGVACPPGDENCADDPIGQFLDSGYLLIGLLGVLGVLLLLIALFYVSWRMHTFRVSAEVVEVKSGVLFRTHRKARLDRIQGVSVSRPLFARLFGAGKLDVEVAGQDANVQLSYLGNAASDLLRADILRLASGSRAASSSRTSPGGTAASRLARRTPSVGAARPRTTPRPRAAGVGSPDAGGQTDRVDTAERQLWSGWSCSLVLS